MYIQRFIKDQILKYIDYKEYIAIIGPRQVGKTTLMKFIQDYLSNRKTVLLNIDYLDLKSKISIELYLHQK